MFQNIPEKIQQFQQLDSQHYKILFSIFSWEFLGIFWGGPIIHSLHQVLIPTVHKWQHMAPQPLPTATKKIETPDP